MVDSVVTNVKAVVKSANITERILCTPSNEPNPERCTIRQRLVEVQGVSVSVPTVSRVQGLLAKRQRVNLDNSETHKLANGSVAAMKEAVQRLRVTQRTNRTHSQD